MRITILHAAFFLLAFPFVACSSSLPENGNHAPTDPVEAGVDAEIDASSSREGGGHEGGGEATDAGDADVLVEASIVDGGREASATCNATTPESRACGKCGTETRVCEKGAWSAWGTCSNETGSCVPNSTQSIACGNCGTLAMTCTNGCYWSYATTCANQGCKPGDLEVDRTGCASPDEAKQRTCSSTCGWSAWGACATIPSGWRNTASLASVNYTSVVEDLSAAWTGTEMIAWGGRGAGDEGTNEGVRYRPDLDTWTKLPAPPIAGRFAHAAAWTSSKFIVWGGYTYSQGALKDGAEYDPVSNTWTTLPPAEWTVSGSPVKQVLVARAQAAAVWSPLTEELIVWGGRSNTGFLSNGAAYKPQTGTWRPMAAAPLSPRQSAGAVWAGDRMVVYGGRCLSWGGACADAATYDPVSNTWTKIANGPGIARELMLAIPTPSSPSQANFWGGYSDGAGMNANGSTYSPLTNQWSTMPLPSASAFPNAARMGHTGWWGAGRLWIWGGEDPFAALAAYHENGASFDPQSNTWIAMPATGAPSARRGAASVWTGREAIVMGGVGLGTYKPEAKIFRP